ncbi:type VI secretion protein IcmF [Salmonella enterica subsp. enterica]|nr:type VI secretion protein IcmF [Salmonella enterica subsp. enterica]
MNNSPTIIRLTHAHSQMRRWMRLNASLKPNGVLDTFYQQNLRLFMENDLSLEDGDNNVIIREDVREQTGYRTGNPRGVFQQTERPGRAVCRGNCVAFRQQTAQRAESGRAV